MKYTSKPLLTLPLSLWTVLCLATAVYNASANLSGSYTFSGTTTPTDQTGPWNMTSDEIASARLRFVLDTPIKFKDIANINYDYDVNVGGIGASRPRTEVVLDSDGDGLSDGVILIRWGSVNVFDDPTVADNLNTGNLIGVVDAFGFRYDNSGVGGLPFSIYAESLLLAGEMNVLRINVYIAPGTGTRDFDINSVNVSAVPEPTTMVAGALLLLPFGMSTIRKFRKNRTA